MIEGEQGTDAGSAAVASVRESLRRRVEELESLIEAIPAYVWLARDPACREIVGNAAANGLLGFAHGTNASQTVVTEGLAPKLLQYDRDGRELAADELPLQRALAQRAPVEDFEFQMVVPDGRRVWLRGNAVPLFEADGRTVRGGLGAFLDVSALRDAGREIEDRERRLSLATQAARAGFWEWDVLSGEVHWTAEIDEMYGVSRRSIRTYEEWRRFVHPDDLARVEEEARVLSERPLHDFEFRIVRDDGGIRWLYARGGRVAGADGRARIAGINLDVTERKNAQLALEDANRRLRESDRRKNEFLALLSHELRNPLAPLANSLVLIESGLSDPAAKSRALQVAKRQFAHLTRLVDDLLDVNRIVSGKIRLEPATLDLALLVRRVLEDHRTLFDAQQVELVADVGAAPLWVHGDEARLTQAVGNLLQNARKFTDRGGRVAVALRDGGGQAVLTVRDTGIGMDADVLARAFEPFAQGERTTLRSSGPGLGLALVKGIVERHGGAVSAASDGVGRGAAFRIELPLVAAPAHAPARSAARGGGTRHRILIVEDNEDSALSLQALLEVLGHDAVAVFDGASGVAAFVDRSPDTVICDIGLPDMSGYDVARRIRALSGARPLLLVALSGYGMETDRIRSAEAGFDAHFTKPADPELLQKLLA